MKNRAAKKALIFAIVLVVIAAAAFGGHQLRRELTVSYAWPDVVLLVEDEPQPDFVHSEFYGEQRSFMNRVVGGDMEAARTRESERTPTISRRWGI